MAGVEFNNKIAGKEERLTYYKDQNRKKRTGGRPTQFSGTVTDTSILVSFSERSTSLYIRNNDSAEDLQLSFDAGTTNFTLTPGQTFNDTIDVDGVTLTGEAAGTDYEVIVIL